VFKNHKLSWPAVVLAAVCIAAFVAVWLLAPEDRDTLEKGVLALWAAVQTFLGPAIRRKLDHELADEDREASS
jgi:hypothetical protein